MSLHQKVRGMQNKKQHQIKEQVGKFSEQSKATWAIFFRVYQIYDRQRFSESFENKHEYVIET